MNENHLNFQEIQNEHLDHMIRLAFKQEASLQAQQLIKESEQPLTPEEQLHAQKLLERMLTQINRRERADKRQRRRALARKFVPKIIEAAACMVLVIGIAAPIAIANVDSIRSKVMQLLIRFDWEKGEAHMNFVEDESASFDVPADWPGDYFPSYLPEGFEVTWRSQLGFPCIEYQSKTGQQVICYDEKGPDTTTVSGIEGGVISYVEINGHTAIVIETENPVDEAHYSVGITWDNGEKWFDVNTSGLTKAEAVRIAQSVKKILKK